MVFREITKIKLFNFLFVDIYYIIYAVILNLRAIISTVNNYFNYIFNKFIQCQ